METGSKQKRVGSRPTQSRFYHYRMGPRPKPGRFHSDLGVLGNGFRLGRTGLLAFDQAEGEPGQIADTDGEHDVSRNPQPYQAFHDGVVDEFRRACIPEAFGDTGPGDRKSVV